MSLSTDDRELLSEVRAGLGLSSEAAVTDDDLERELTESKRLLSREMYSRLAAGETLSFTGRERDALHSLLVLRAARLKGERGVGGGSPASQSVPRVVSVGSATRTNFGDSQLNFHRDALRRALSEVTDGN